MKHLVAAAQTALGLGIIIAVPGYLIYRLVKHSQRDRKPEES